MTATKYPPLFEQSCEICRYGEEQMKQMARCKRHAPTPLPIDQEVMARWPLVMLTDWCGEWTPREQDQ